MDSSPTRSNNTDAALMAFCICLCAFLVAHTSSDYDLWGHLKFGLDYIQNGHIPETDTYSYVASGSRWISHSWLFELVIAFAYNLFSKSGLCVLKFALSLSTLLVLLYNFRRNGLSALSSTTLTLIAAFVMLHFLTALRPQLCTYLLFAVELVILQQAQQGRHKALYALPLLFVAWSNLHGGFVAGLLLLALWCVYYRQFAILLLSVVATSINPYGVFLWKFLFKTLSLPRPEITEWLPLKLLSLDGAGYLIVLVIAAAALYTRWKTGLRQNSSPGDARHRPYIECALLAVTAAAPLVAYRHLPLFVITAMVVTAPMLAALYESGKALALPEVLKMPARAILYLAAVCSLCFALPLLTNINVGSDMPQKAVALLADNHVKGNLATHFDWGEYCIFHLYPSMKVSTDGRREEVYTPETHAINVHFLYAEAGWQRLLTDYPTDVVLAPRYFPVFDAMSKQPDWQLVYEDGLSGIFVKKDQAGQAPWSNLKNQVPVLTQNRFP